MTTWAKGYQQSKDLWLQRFGGKIKEEAPTKKIRAADVGLCSRKMPHIALVSPRQHQLRKITTERRQLWRLLRRSMAVFLWQHGVTAAAEAFGVGKHVVHYWRRKLTDLTFHPKPWGGFEY